jgi:hypothetical protein
VGGDSNVDTDLPAQPPARESQKEQRQAFSPTEKLAVTAQTFVVSPRHEVSGTYGFRWFVQQHSVGANCLIAMLLHNYWFAKKQRD